MNNVITFAILQNGKVAHKLRLFPGDILKHFPVQNGKPVFGPNVRRIMTIKEIMQAGLADSKNKAGDLLRNEPEKCLLPIAA